MICVNRRAVVHPTSRVDRRLIREIYGGDVRMVRHSDVVCQREHVEKGIRGHLGIWGVRAWHARLARLHACGFAGPVRLPAHSAPRSINRDRIFQALWDPDVRFLRYALLAGAPASVSLGIIGAYVVTRRISYLGGAISHCVLSGIGLGLFLQTVGGYAWCHPMYGAVLSACWRTAHRPGQPLRPPREDTVIGPLGCRHGRRHLVLAATPGYTDR